ncbi:hypothetical protein C0989_008294 [Termitomyces sp. Mn162]|nr:hypothetical protein C0989_008294 [Termitomyces sp. Mn162]
MPSLTISSASKSSPVARGFPIAVEYTATTTIADVKAQIIARFPNFHIARQKLNLKTDKANLDDEKKIVDIVGEKGGELQVKDLGPQISWRTFAELSNLHTHLTLRSLRPANSRVRAIPHGYGFSLISCPNYFFETLAWTVITVMTGSIAGRRRFRSWCADL